MRWNANYSVRGGKTINRSIESERANHRRRRRERERQIKIESDRKNER